MSIDKTASRTRGPLLGGVALVLLMPTAAFAQAYGIGGGTATGGNAVAIGSGSTAAGNGGVAIGQTATASQTGATSIGLNTQATQVGATALGNAASATANSATALGTGTSATAQNATAVGFGASATGASTTSIGDSAGTGAGSGSAYNSSVGFVSGQNVTGTYNSGIGASAGQNVTGNYNTGVGAGAGIVVTGDGNLAGGLQAGQYVQGNANVALGYNAGQGTATTPLAVTSTVAIGAESLASANNAVAIGRQSAASGLNALAAGPGSTATGVSSVALGDGAVASYAQSVALGAGSATGVAAPTGTGYLTGAPAPASEVSIGAVGATRRLTNLADGSSATDAVNVAQLTGVNNKLDTLGNGTATALGGGASYSAVTGAIGAPVYALAGGTYTGVGAALGALDTVNNAQSSSVAALLGGGTTALANGTISGGSFKAGSTGGTYADVADALANIDTTGGTDPNAVHYDDASHTRVTLNSGGPTAIVTNVAAGAIAAGSTDAVNGSQLAATNTQVASNTTGLATLNTGIATGTIGLVQQVGGAPGAGTITVGAATGGTVVNVAGTDGNRLVSGVAAGVAPTDAVNVSQLTSTVGAATSNAVQYDDASHTRVTLNGGGAAAAVTNVAAGTIVAGSTDAVNGSQLATTNTQVASNTTNIGNLNTGIATGTIGLVQQVGGAPGNGAITVGAATGGTVVNFTGTAGARVLSGVAPGVATTDAVDVGQLTAAVGGATANAVQYDNASHTSVTLNPGDAAAGLHNVAAGALTATSTDAVNGSQLAATNTQVAANTAGLMGVTNQVAINTTTIASQSTSISALQTGKAGAFQADNSGRRAAPAPTGTNAVAGGFGAVASAAQSSAIGTAASATGFNSVALGYGSTDGGVANVVSVGSAGGERQVTNVAAGTRATDAVNVGQLTSGLTNTLNQANAYTDQRFAGIDYDLSRARRDASAGTAAAMAMASLPQAFKPGGGLIAGGFGVYRDQTAFAFGASKSFDDGHTIVKASGTIDSHGTAGGAVGMGYQF